MKKIVHFDGDAFFASVEQMMDYTLRGKPVVTGGERNIAASMSYEAKRKGVTRGMTVFEIKKICPDAIILPSDYESYSIFARRMYNIVRRFTPNVEEYSIDECFADITGCGERLGLTSSALALKIKEELEEKLGVTFGVGLASSKVLAKVGSKHRKPAGFTEITGENIYSFLKDLPIEKIWGIGGATALTLGRLGIKTAFDFKEKSYDWLLEHKISKPYQEIWYELHGCSVKKLVTESVTLIGSIIKSRTFTPATGDRHFVLSQLSKNIENACIKARRHGLAPRRICFYLKTHDFRYFSKEISLEAATFSASIIVSAVSAYFDEVYDRGEKYRASGIVLFNLVPPTVATIDFFGQTERGDSISKIFRAVDFMNRRYGKHTLFLCSSLTAMNEPQHEGKRGMRPRRKTELFFGENKRKRIDIPFLGKAK